MYESVISTSCIDDEVELYESVVSTSCIDDEVE